MNTKRRHQALRRLAKLRTMAGTVVSWQTTDGDGNRHYECVRDVEGDVYVDKTARIWFCTKASSGAVAAVWKQLA